MPILAAMFDLTKRAVVLTGATGNIGPAVIRAYLEQGAHIAIAVRDAAKGAALKVELGGDERLMVASADPADRPAMERLVEQVLRAWGRLDILANLVGGYAASAAAEGDLAAYRASWEQKVATAVTATAACIRPMRARGYGRIVSVASMAALKGAKREGITANVVLPRIIDTPENRAAMPKSDPSRWATPAEIAAVVVFLSSDEASGVTGAAIPVPART